MASLGLFDRFKRGDLQTFYSPKLDLDAAEAVAKVSLFFVYVEGHNHVDWRHPTTPAPDDSTVAPGSRTG